MKNLNHGEKRNNLVKFSQNKLFEILDFYKSRNQSSEYSIKIFTKINKNIALLKKHPEIGIKTDISSVRALSVENYLIFYETEPQRIIILSIWDTRQNPLKSQ